MWCFVDIERRRHRCSQRPHAGASETRGQEFDDRWERVHASIEARLSEAFGGGGLVEGNGLTTIHWHLDNTFGINSDPFTNRGKLEQAAHEAGIYARNHVSWYVLARYLKARGADSEVLDGFVAKMPAEDESKAMPAR